MILRVIVVFFRWSRSWKHHHSPSKEVAPDGQPMGGIAMLPWREMYDYGHSYFRIPHRPSLPLAAANEEEAPTRDLPHSQSLRSTAARSRGHALGRGR